MNLFRLFFFSPEIELSTYRIAEGEEEYRVKREILSNIRNGSSGTALEPTGECSARSDGNTPNA